MEGVGESMRVISSDWSLGGFGVSLFGWGRRRRGEDNGPLGDALRFVAPWRGSAQLGGLVHRQLAGRGVLRVLKGVVHVDFWIFGCSFDVDDSGASESGETVRCSTKRAQMPNPEGLCSRLSSRKEGKGSEMAERLWTVESMSECGKVQLYVLVPSAAVVSNAVQFGILRWEEGFVLSCPCELGRLAVAALLTGQAVTWQRNG